MAFLLFLVGFLSGALSICLLAVLILFNLFGKKQNPTEQEQLLVQPNEICLNKTRIPSELKAFLRSAPDGQGSEWESATSMSLFLHFLFQEQKDTRQFRRWMYKKLQLELNDVTARSSTAGRIIQGIQIRDLEAGTNSPVVNRLRVERFKLSEDDPDCFEELTLLLQLDYGGGFQMSVDAQMAFGKFAQLSVKLLHLSGQARMIIRRQPFAHWSFSFVESPQMELKIDSQFQGRNLRHLIPLIRSAFQKVLQLKHVWPNYKLRFRPLFQNPLFSPSPNIAAFEHIDLAGAGLEVTVLCSSRLNLSLVEGDGDCRIFCKVTLSKRPYGGAQSAAGGDTANPTARESTAQHISVLLSFSRKNSGDPLGLSFGTKDSNGGRQVRVDRVDRGSNAAKCGFLVGDCLVAVNNIPVRNERQASRLLSGTAGDLMVLVEREMAEEWGEEEEGGQRDPTPTTPASGLPSPSPSSSAHPIAHQFDLSPHHFALPAVPPVEIKARDQQQPWDGKETVREGKKEKEGNNSEGRTHKYSSQEEEEMIELVHLRRPTSLQKVPKREDPGLLSMACPPPTPSLPSQSPLKKEAEESGQSLLEEEEEKPKIVLQASGSFRHAKGIQRNRALRRSRSEAELNQIMAEARVQADNEEEKAGEDGKLEETTENEQKEEMATTGDGQEKSLAGGGGGKNWSRRERLHAKANEMAKASRSKLNELLLWNRKKTAELAVEVNDEQPPSAEEGQGGGDPALEKPRKKWLPKRKNKSPSPSSTGPSPEKADLQPKPVQHSPPLASASKRTKHVRATTKDPIWGQSLHFPLRRDSVYLNVSVCAEKEAAAGSQHTPPADGVVLGNTSIFVPRIVDDCKLTLSNCHRERFHLRGCKDSEYSPSPQFEELSRHNGFDPRLCFGDILLAFRFFPDGLPVGLEEKEGLQERRTAADDDRNAQEEEAGHGQQQQGTAAVGGHKWLYQHQKDSPCAVCGCKIWVKGAKCERCHLVCHIKCQEKTAGSRECDMRADALAARLNDDGPFEELDMLERVLPTVTTGEQPAERKQFSVEEIIVTTTSGGSEASVSKSVLVPGCRRRRIAETLRGLRDNVGAAYSTAGGGGWRIKWATGSRGETETGGGKSAETPPESPKAEQSAAAGDQTKARPLVAVAQVLDRDFMDSLQGFPADAQIDQLRFEPGNAYNAQVIENAKLKGQQVFGWCPTSQRKARINGQIDRVEQMIDRVTRERRSLPEKSGELFDQIDNRLQALALVMLLYCSGLSDCMDREEAEDKAEGGQQTGSPIHLSAAPGSPTAD